MGFSHTPRRFEMLKTAFPILSILSFFNLHADEPPPAPCEFDRGDQSLSPCMPGTYNCPASIKLKNSCQLFATVSYLYWYAGEDALDLATTAAYLSITNVVIPSNCEEKTIFQDFDYASGFKVGIGGRLGSDNWIVRADYTWLHHSTEKSKSANGSNSIGENALFLTDWFYQQSTQGQGIAASHLCSKWKLELDWLDLSLERPFYSGRQLILTPFMGLRASWIEQSLNIHVTDPLNVDPGTLTVSSRNHLNSWGIGPRAGMDGRFLLGAGFRIQGEMGASLLYTKFSKVSHSEDPFVASGYIVSYAMDNYSCVRAMAEANLGLGWGSYLCNHRYHLDFSATYDFNYLWSQNMLRTLNDLQIIGTNGAAGDLYLQGLTLTCSLDF